MKCERCNGLGHHWNSHGKAEMCMKCCGTGFDVALHFKEDVDTLVSAVWRVLDDMGEGGKCVCGAAKAYARRALEPFLDEEGKRELSYTLEQANALIRQLEKGE